MRRLLPLALVILGLAACGGGDEGGGASSEACPGGSLEIKMADIKFDPKEATASVGQEVCWVNEDTIEHNAVADGGEFESELFGKGQTFSATLDAPGSIPYVCTVHPGMTGIITVER